MTNAWLHFCRQPKTSLKIPNSDESQPYVALAYFLFYGVHSGAFHLDRHFPLKVGKEDVGMPPQSMPH